MQTTGIVAYEGRWPDDSTPTIGETYRITTTSQFPEALQQDVWFTYFNDYTLKDHLYQGDVIEVGPATGVEETERIIVFHLKKILPIRDLLAGFHESAYPKELDDEFESLMEARTWFGAELNIEKTAIDTYILNIDFYGNTTEIIATEIEGKLYAWLTHTGFNIHKCYFGKYLLPNWLKHKIDHPEEDSKVRYYDLGKS